MSWQGALRIFITNFTLPFMFRESFNAFRISEYVSVFQKSFFINLAFSLIEIESAWDELMLGFSFKFCHFSNFIYWSSFSLRMILIAFFLYIKVIHTYTHRSASELAIQTCQQADASSDYLNFYHYGFLIESILLLFQNFLNFI